MFHVSLLTLYVETIEHSKNFSRPPPDLINNNEQYEVEAIHNHRRHRWKKQLQYLVKWVGYSESDNTWEPISNIQALLLIKQYHRC